MTESLQLPAVKILIVDDDRAICDYMQTLLESDGFAVKTMNDPTTIDDEVKNGGYHLIVLDLMLPGMSGTEVCKALKSDPATKAIPVVMLTAKAEEVDRILGFELGADDYLTKPFSPRELVLRVQSVLRRGAGPVTAAEVMKHGDILIDRTRHEVKVRGKVLVLTATEFKLLLTLIERRGRVQSRDVLLNDVWGYESSIDTRTVDTHVRRLREKLGKAADSIETIRGFGYRMIDLG